VTGLTRQSYTKQIKVKLTGRSSNDWC